MSTFSARNVLSIFSFLGLFFTVSYAQQTNATWLFGTNAGLDFSTNPPTAISSPLTSLEGTASISDNNGDLLFYTNGMTMWDRDYLIMPNGTGIQGGSSSTQAALIIPLANYCNKYYVFTSQDHTQAGDIRYSLVDMCLNSGFGDVVAAQKNIFLTTGMSEKLTSVLHGNGSDIWIISHKLSSAEFYAWKVTPDGTVSAPVISSVGFSYAWNNMIGPIKASPDGTKLAACTTFNSYSCELLNFNKNTGAITYDRNLMNYGVPGGVYGLEFSPNSQLLYISSLWGTSTLSQFDLATNSLTQLSSIPGNYHHGALQLGIDGKIYHARNLQSFVGVINNPNTVGVGCNYVDNGQALMAGTQCNAGFPVFNPYSLSGTQPVTANLISDTLVTLCPGGQYTTTVGMDCNATILWSNGSNSPTLTITQPGTYSVILTNPCGQLFDTVVVQMDNSGASMTLPADMNFCTFPAGGVTITPTIQGTPNGTETYTWNNGSQNTTLQANAPGTYWLEYGSSCGVVADTVVISVGVSPSITLPPSITVCEDDYPYTLIPVLADYNSFSWSDGVLTLQRQINGPGTYTLSADNLCGTTTASVTVATGFAPTVSLPVDIDTCLNAGNGVPIVASVTNATSLVWNTGGQTNSITATVSGTYVLDVTNQCGSDSDTIDLIINPFPEINGPNTVTYCFGQSTVVTPEVNNATDVVWEDGSTLVPHTIAQAGIYMFIATNQCGADTLVITAAEQPFPEVNSQSLIDTCMQFGGTVNLSATGSNVDTYSWNTGSNISTASASTSGEYWVSGENACGTDTAFVSVFINYFPQLSLPAILDTCFTEEGFYYTAQGSEGSYSWSSGSTTATEWIGVEGLYTCTLTNSCGSVSTSMQVNRVADIEIFIPSDSMLFCLDELAPATLGIEVNYPYQLLNDQHQPVVGNILETGWYTVSAINACGERTDSIYVDLMEEAYFYLPNTFTPNADETNELYDDKGYNYFIERTEIFNRWGELIYSESGDFSGWDGNYCGLPCPDGIYQVQIVYNDCAGRSEQFNGHVLLLR